MPNPNYKFVQATQTLHTHGRHYRMHKYSFLLEEQHIYKYNNQFLEDLAWNA